MRRGLIFSLSSNIIFFLSGYVLHYFLGSTMSAANYGIVGTIITVLDFEYMFLSNGARQSLSKEISMRRFNNVDVIVKTLGFQLIIIAFFFVVNFFGAPLFGIALQDNSLAFYFRLAAFLIPANGLFVILLGINDGLQQFGISALLGVFYPLTKLSAIPLILFVFRDRPVIGVEAGFLLALLLSILVGVILLVGSWPRLSNGHPGKGVERISFSAVARSTLSFSFFFIVVSLVLSVDTLTVKSLVHPAQMAGYYTGAVNFGKLSYYLMSAFVTVVLPVIAKLVGEGKHNEAITRAREIVLIAVAFILPIAVVISASSAPLLGAFYGADYRIAATALSCLSLSNFFMGMTVMLNMMLHSYGDRRFSDLLSIVSLIVVIPAFGTAAHFSGISGIAVTSMACTCLLMLISWVRVRRILGEVMTARSGIAAACSLLLWVLTKLLVAVVHPATLFGLGAMYVVLYGIYVGIILACRIVPIPQLRRISND
ncbi:lipopolysaccharide biosynthesis protein [Bifidobacterium mongoliense]|uniref:lipopolysaccharide biosynthesis protein n=1 Tax=Bifidobacterium mongoliense TaxID=518643 RepID=UPI0030EE73F5